MSTMTPQQDESLAALTTSAAALLLRSPALTLSQILDLLDIGDAEFREMTRSNPRIARLLERRRAGELSRPEDALRACAACGEWFLPYAGSRQCSDECRRIARLERTSRS